ncbi:electron transfer flavoprotein subunit alpha [Geothrix limicola]|uniref:Electron transfer flavoprotein subunit alpha n=1 Tax=Geothrix limicola TaxID=2927978 RepID=A0ABQ5QFI4_9BACT|nr:electron transfer flavoprotein subunit alpha/FixB family protein [Geothrix limicola]GLH73599.1 electron transfer flavoprotein subunit alpha [Geothrix limicola]
MAANVFALIAHAAGKADDSALELLSAAKSLFPEAAPTALVLGSGPGLKAVAQEVAASFPEVWSFDQETLAYPNAELIRPLLVKVLPAGSIVILPHSTLGIDLGPGLSVKLGAAYLPDVVGFDGVEGTQLKVVRQEFAGQVSAHVQGDVSKGAVVTVRSGAFAPASPSAVGTVIDKSPEAAGLSARRRFVEVVQAEAGDVDITREEVLVAVGRGIGEQDNLSLVDDLAEAMGATVCCSRPIVDAKWLEKGRQVGTSGQTVKPKIYLALGISGAFQHLGGLKGSPFIVAVNKNPKAPIFQAAQVGVVADLVELLPELTEQIQKAR